MKFFTVLLFLTLSLSFLRGSEIERWIEKYEQGEYEETISGLRNLLYPLSLTKKEEIVKAHLYLGFCYSLLGEVEKARKHFRELLKLEPTKNLDKNLVPAKIFTIFEEVKEAFQPPPSPKQPTVKIKKSWRERITPFLPFGLEEFKKTRKIKGILYTAFESIGLLVSVGAYLIYSRDRLDGHYRDYEKAEKLREVQQIGFATFGLTYLFSLTDRFFLSKQKGKTE